MRRFDGSRSRSPTAAASFRAYLESQERLMFAVAEALKSPSSKGRPFQVVLTGVRPSDGDSMRVLPLIGAFSVTDLAALSDVLKAARCMDRGTSESADDEFAELPPSLLDVVRDAFDRNLCALGATISLARGGQVVEHLALYGGAADATSEWDLMTSAQVERMSADEWDALWEGIDTVSQNWHFDQDAVRRLSTMCSSESGAVVAAADAVAS